MKTLAGLTLGLMVSLSACGGISTTTDWDPAFSFANNQTYTWIDSEGESGNSITNSRIETSVDAAMAARGFRRVDSGGDLAMAFQVTTDQRRSFSTVNTGWGGGWGWHGGWGGGGMGMGMGMSTTTEHVWDEGTLILGLFETTNKDLVWTGAATAELNQTTPEERQKLIDDAVEKLMKDFPPGS